MEPPSGEAPRARAEREVLAEEEASGARPGSRLLLSSFQYVHVQLAGGAPWGFTLKGGLEHGEPLIVSKVEDGGKAALSQKMRSGDELVNINGAPLHGSRQEALILIKGSYRTLKMIIRRRSGPVLRPHSWHLARLSEVRTEATTMPFPAETFSLSWHSGCDASDLPWNALSRHCSTDKSSSLGSMDSEDRSSQAYYEGSLSPVDQAMCQDKRDSAYSSFSASSNASDSALRPEEHSPSEGPQPGQLPEPRYLQTGSEGAEPVEGAILLHFLAGQVTPGPPSAPSTQENCFSRSAKTVPAPPEPPVRRDSLRACNPPSASTETPRPSPVEESLQPKGRWTSDTFLCVRGRDPEEPSHQPPPAGHPKESVATEQYYLLSSHTDQPPPMEKELQSIEESRQQQQQQQQRSLAECHEPGHSQEEEAAPSGPEACPSPWKACYSGPFSHRHSAPEHLLAAQLKALNVAQSPEGHHWTVSPLHQEPQCPPEPGPGQSCPGQAPPLAPRPEPEEQPPFLGSGSQPERPQGTSVEPSSATSAQPLPEPVLGLSASPSTDTLAEERRPETEGAQAAARKAGSVHHRSAQMRRRSDRFATNLRNEIQWRKAQLQKAKGSALLPGGEETVQETDEPPKRSPSPVSPRLPPSAEGRPPSAASQRLGPPRRWGSELSVFVGEEAHARSPSRPSPVPKWKAPAQEPERPPKGLPPLGWRGGCWRWSPEHKLQPHNRSPPTAEPQSPSEESGLLPFADRRRFFEETSRPRSSVHPSPARAEPRQPRQASEQNVFQPVCSERRDQRRHSMDQAYRPLSSPPIYPDFHPEGAAFYNPLAQHWRPFPCSCASREACVYCCGERCPATHQRSLPGPSAQCTHPCRSRPWAHCSDCCCPAQRQLLEERGPWLPRKAFPMEFPADEWERPAMNRSSSQSMGELAQRHMGYARISPFWARLDNADAERPPFCRAISTQNLLWDCEQPERRAAQSVAYEEASHLPRQHPLRGRAYSESQLCGELTSAPERERQAPPRGKLEEAQQELQCTTKRKGPPPPRPPPPNWEKYHPRRASHNQLLLPKASLCPLPEDAHAHSQDSSEAPRQRSQSLPLEQLWDESGLQPSPRPQDVSSPTERDASRYCCHGSPPPDLSERSRLSRPGSSPEDLLSPEPRWENERPRAANRASGQGQASPSSLASPVSASAPEGLEGESHPPGTAAPAPPSRLNSEELMRDVADRDRSLAGVLVPTLGLAVAAEVMGELFSPGEDSVWKGHSWPPQAADLGLPERPQARPVSPASTASLGSGSYASYYSLSAGKAELLNKMKERPELCGACSEDEDYDLTQKKVQLIESISRKLGVLQEAQRGLQDDISANVDLGKEVENHVKAVCKAHEVEKFRLFIGDLDKVVNLLLSLLGRLARVENALSGLESDVTVEGEEEKLALLEKKRQLTAQLEDAKELQEHVARRERLVFASVSRCLGSEQLQDYQHFVRMKSALAVQQRQLDDKIKLGEEQLRCLRESLRRMPRDL